MSADQSIMPDGTIIDHVAEFVYGHDARVPELYYADRAAYIDALARFFQALATSERIAFGRGDPKTEATFRLREQLLEDERVELTDSLEAEERRRRREGAWPFLREIWPKICEWLERDSLLVEGLEGHLRRECRYYWLGEDPTWNADHYVSAEDALQLPVFVRERLVGQASQAVNRERPEIKDEDLRLFVDRTFTTNYLIFCEHWKYMGQEYLPSYTRGNLPFLWDQTKECRRLLSLIARSFAVERIAKTRGRADLVKVALDWGRSAEGEEVRQNVAGLRASMQVSDVEEREKLLKEAEQVLGARAQTRGKIKVNCMKMVSSAASGNYVGAATAAMEPMDAKGPLRWLLKVPGESLVELEQYARNLVRP